MHTHTAPGNWFEAATRFGPLRLRTGMAAARHAAEAALALQRCEELLAALEQWSGAELAWGWIAAAAVQGIPGAEAHALWRPTPSASDAAADEAILIVWPWALLRALPAPPDALARRLVWPAVPVVLSIARMRIGRDELALLEPGGAVVLPPSLQPPWRGVLRSAAEIAGPAAGIGVDLSSPLQPRLLETRTDADESRTAEVDNGGPDVCEVQLAAPHALAGDRLTGWYDEPLTGTDKQHAHASLWRCAHGRMPTLCLAIGRLMPWGEGWALALEALCDDTLPVLAAKV